MIYNNAGKKLVLFSTLAFAVVLLSGCMDKDQDVKSQDTVMTGDTTTNTTTGDTTTTTGMLVGNDKDDHGCIASAGYTRNEAKQECTRSREDNQATGTTTTKTITLADISNHKTESDCRTAINGTVYDVTAFFGKHPGGDKNLFRVCGIDATEVFNKKHGNDPKANNVLAGFEIGTLTQ